MARVFIEGLPGAGKTTTSKILRQKGIPVARDFGLAQGAEDYPGNGTSVDGQYGHYSHGLGIVKPWQAIRKSLIL
jgi:hypothetical protein